jgi:hypothetical protein
VGSNNFVCGNASRPHGGKNGVPVLVRNRDSGRFPPLGFVPPSFPGQERALDSRQWRRGMNVADLPMHGIEERFARTKMLWIEREEK